MIIFVFADRHLLLRQFFDTFWKLRVAVREQATTAPTPNNVAERNSGIRRVNLPDPVDFDDNLETMTICHALELGLNKLHQAGFVYI